MFIAVTIFFLGRKSYVHRNPEQNVVADYAKVIWTGIKTKTSAWRGHIPANKWSHWLEPAEKRFGAQFVEDVRSANAVLYLFLPLPIFWTLFDQSGSRWTLQATMMCGSFYL